MSVDSDHPEDDLIFDDEEFSADEPEDEPDKYVFDEADAEGDQAPGGEGLVGENIGQVFDENRPAPQAESTYSDGEDETLFADQSVQGETTESFSSGREFSEESGAGWGGVHTDLEDLGIPMDDDIDPLASDSDQEFDLDAEGQELELVEHESELDTIETELVQPPTAFSAEQDAFEAAEPQNFLSDEQGEVDADDYVLSEEELVSEAAEPQYSFSDEEIDAGEMEYVLSEEEQESEAEAQYVLSDEEESDEWAPVGGLAAAEEDYVLADDQGETYADEPQPEYAEAGEPDYAEYEESYVESHEDYETSEVEPRRRFRLVSMASGLAAACLIAAAGTVVVMKPELFGLKVEPELVDVVQIDRPRIDLTLAAPVLEPIVVTPDPVTPDPVTPDPVTPDPVTPDPVVPDPVTPDPVTPDPVTPDPVTPDPVLATPDPLGPDSGPILLGETGMAIGEFAEETVEVAAHPLTMGVAPGSQAFAQLKNGNFFIGKVKTVNAPIDITLSVDKGEVTLALAELRTLAPLGSDEYMELQQAERGFVRLTNNNLLRGTILRYGRDDNVILEMKSNQILIPRTAIEEMGNQSSDSRIHVDDSADNDWVRRLVEEEMVRDSGPNPLRGTTQTLPVNRDD